VKNRCSNKSCNQRPLLYQTGYSSKQGCTHCCHVCGWGYWTHEIEPSTEEISEVQKLNKKMTYGDIKKALTKEVLKPYPQGEWGKTAEKKMIEHLGGHQPEWLPHRLKIYWRAKYLELNSPDETKK